MQLYSGPAHHFIQDAFHNAIAGKLRDAFVATYRYQPPEAEVRAWRNSLKSMSHILEHGELQSTSILLEYQLPLSSRRLDCMVIGESPEDSPNAVIVELKQWEEALVCDVDDCVLTWVGGAEREVLHPSAQVDGYRTYLADMHTAFQGDGAIDLHACSFLHNVSWDASSALLDPRYRRKLDAAPLYFGDQAEDLTDHLRSKLRKGDIGALLERIIHGGARPSKALMRHVAAMIQGHPAYTLLDEQLVVFNTIMAMAQRGYHGTKKAVVIVQGGPGTGKSVIAANLVGKLSALQYHTQHATGSRAFTENLRRAVGSRARSLFNYFSSYGDAPNESVDVIICDEAHRLRQTSDSRYVRRAERSERPQINELIDAAKVAVFFIDDLQVVRPQEVGSATLIREAAARAGAFVREYELDIQFRCKGSEAFVNWVDNTLQVRKTQDVLWRSSEAFDFQIVKGVEALEYLIVKKAEAGFTARLTAGFCWPWSMKLQEDGRLVDDVTIGAWKRPWNARPEMRKLPSDVPTSNFWATDPRGLKQVGCVYTAQGFEFDYVGVIFGADLTYDRHLGKWVGNPKVSRDTKVRQTKEGFVDLVKQTYRVLLTRGLKGCYVTFLDSETEAFCRSRLDDSPGMAAETTYEPRLQSVQQVAEPSIDLSKGGHTAWAAIAPFLGLQASERPPQELSDVANDLAHAMDRPDLSNWRKDKAVEERLRNSLRKTLGSGVSEGVAEDALDSVIAAFRDL